MRVPVRWLAEFVELPQQSPEELAAVLSGLGHEVEAIDRIEAPFSGVVVARVEEVEAHPDADRIRLCVVSTPEGSAEVVCGAWNFEAGAVVPLARPGAVLAGGVEVGVRTIRGVVSHGMICSEQELALGDDHEGIMVLDPSAPLGSDFAELLEFPQVVLDLAITPNRPDAMSVHGIARDLAAFYDTTLRLPPVDSSPSSPPSRASVRVEDPDGCPRFVAQEVREVTVGPSPLPIQARLRAAGVRPINNVVDVTNYVMLELGQPLHAFDLDRLAGEQLVVRRARKGEHLRTLDGVDRELDFEDLIIADGAEVVSLAGIMGGESSEVSASTTRVLVEGAHWHPPTILYGSRRHGLRSEASARFERGVDPNLPQLAVARAVRLIADLGKGEVAEGGEDVYPEPIVPWLVELPRQRVTDVLGSELEPATVSDLLRRLGMRVEGDDPLSVTVPTYRPDVQRPIDLVEEVARLYGYDRFPETLPLGHGGGLTVSQRRERRLRQILLGAGYDEAYVFSFLGQQDLDLLGLPSDDPRRRGIAVRNPLREDQGVLRTTLLPGLLRAASHNTGHGVVDVALFEIGKVFLPIPDRVDPRIPDQPDHLGLVRLGREGLRGVGVEGRSADIYSATATLGLVASGLGIGDLELRAATLPALHPGRGAEVVVAGRPIGFVGELHPAVVRRFGLEGRVAVAEIALGPLTAPVPNWQLQEPSLFPPVVFDLAFEADADLPAADLIEAIRQGGGPWLESVRLFDVFSGPPLGEGRKSLAVRLAYRAPDHTMTDEEVAPLRREVIAHVEEKLGAVLRGGAG